MNIPHTNSSLNFSEAGCKHVSHLQASNSNSTSTMHGDPSQYCLAFKFFLGVFCVTVPAIGVPTCLTIVSTIATFRELRTCQNAFVTSLALRDMMLIGVLLPIFYVNFLMGVYPFGKRVCLLQLMFAFSFSLGSVMELMNIAISRYVKICCHIGTYRYIYTKRNTVFFISLTWILSFLAGVPVSTKHGDLNDETHLCYIQKSPLKAFVTSFILVTAVAVTSFCYLSIWRTVRKAKENLKRFNEGPTRHRTVNHNFQTFLRDFLVFILYLFFLLPFVLLNGFGLSSPRFLAWDVAKLLSFTNNFTNCVIYGLLNKQIRIRFIRVLTCYKHRQRTNVVTPYTITATGMSRTALHHSTNPHHHLNTYRISTYAGGINNNNFSNNTTI